MKRQSLMPRCATRWCVTVFFYLLLSPGAAISDDDARPGALTRESTLELLQKIDGSTRGGVVVSTSSGVATAFYPFTECIHDWGNARQDALLFLSAIRDLDADLDALTKSDQPLEVQYWGMYLLVQRGSPAGVRLAAEWMRSDDRMRRYAGWNAVGDCPNSEVVWNVLSPQLALELYRIESDSYVTEKIVEVFGRHKARFAVDALCRTLANSKGDKWCYGVVSALGEIGDPRAIETLTRVPYISSDIISALARIGDAKGANCVIENMKCPGAPLALARIGGPKALPALKRELDHVQWLKEVDDGSEPDLKGLRDCREDELDLALSIVKEPDPQRAWMAVAEATDCGDYRSRALSTLQWLGVSRVRPRFLTFYRRAMTSEQHVAVDGKEEVRSFDNLNCQCILVAEADLSDETTEALKEHLSILCKPYVRPATVDAHTHDAYLIEAMREGRKAMVVRALHRRIGNEVFALRSQFAKLQSADKITESTE